MMIGNIAKMQYRMALAQIRKRMKEGNKVKPIVPADNNGDKDYEQISKEQNKQIQKKQ